MTPDQAKKHLPLIQAFAEGKTIQYRVYDRSLRAPAWRDCIGNGGNGNFAYPTFNGEGEYRIKPDTIKVRRYIYKDSLDYGMAVCNKEKGSRPDLLENNNYFHKWIDNDWVEVEV